MTSDEKILLTNLYTKLRIEALKINEMHGWWDAIHDISAFLTGQETLVQHSAKEWIEYAQELLARKKK